MNIKKNKRKGFSLLELILVMGIIVLLFSPMITSFIGAQKRLESQSQIDSRLNEVVDFIKDDVSNATSSSTLGGEPIAVYLDDIDTTIISTNGTKVRINSIDSSGNKIIIDYFLEGDELKLRTSDGTTTITVLENVEDMSFRYKDKILLMYFKLKTPTEMENKVRREVRDVAITRIIEN